MQDYAEAVAAARDQPPQCPLCGKPATSACAIRFGGTVLVVVACPCVTWPTWQPIIRAHKEPHAPR